ncbi:MAG: ArsR/SmtB family transcription factor, partial [Spirochaetota bacterium]
LCDGELSVNEITEIMGMGQSRISRHLKILSDSSICSVRKDGLWSFYSAAAEGDGARFLTAVSYMFEGADFSADNLRARILRKERSQMTSAFFDTVASSWDDLKKRIIGEIDLNGEISRRLPGKGTAADLGSGTGELATHLFEQGYSVIGVDSSRTMIRSASKKIAVKGFSPDFRIGQLEHLPLRDGEADCAVISMALHHVASPDDAAREVFRIVKKGGSAVVADYDAHTREQMRTEHHDRWLGFSKKELSRYFESAGFSIKGVVTLRKGGLAVNILSAYKQ